MQGGIWIVKANNRDSRAIEKCFCTVCNREVPKHEASREQTIVVKGDQVVDIKDELRHKNCGGTLLALKLLN